ncbi:endolysin; inhibits RNA polymerase [Ruegeria phage DSS3-P1]|uniref:endolysin; inhibits RNA polymerase n=1 Tax=Ruegeria phage DSS3-P1 TaxID=1555208 RepID=UPI00051A9248|nr:endolysin; inhibits RNA polymerase [Ruegeria phage DSS3-P1]YP_009997295.1 endolysin; inhibits RNA polymerase [Ruegeria phage vB_RpoS-V18]YP_009997377.1 endolysin; inhibits RNA polymerase [Ruegeria phage vB_RpoS-V11]YP_009997461.1 endolysin; inhibits RNA polymerase [Ruegeria phage vB_RpoS-V7]AIT13313.1 hypothetical protein DSS3P1_78 [Ruegeria phage DSS3-P1]AWY08783.1 hypothetical protein vBRpoSV7_80 [Ruegeria phage vB_RpoS-V7]AWY08954.1 hypothetical protein vBRpoSV18_78 [Ruegeria phage vB_R
MAKPGIYAIPPTALLHCGAAMHNGCEKYGLTNWREHEVSASVYYNAAFRHLAAWWDGEREAEDSGVHHLGHVMACCAVLLDAEHMGKLRDDRPAIPGPFSFAVAEMTKPQAEEGKQTWGGFCQDIAASAEAAFAKHEADEQLEADCEEIALRVLSTGSLDDAKAVIRAYLTGGWDDEEDFGEALGNPEHWEDESPEVYAVEEAKDAGFAVGIDAGESAGTGDDRYVVVQIEPEITYSELESRIRAFVDQDRTRWLAQFTVFCNHIGSLRVASYSQNNRTRLAFYIGCATEGLDASTAVMDDALRMAGFEFGAA